MRDSSQFEVQPKLSQSLEGGKPEVPRSQWEGGPQIGQIGKVEIRLIERIKAPPGLGANQSNSGWQRHGFPEIGLLKVFCLGAVQPANVRRPFPLGAKVVTGWLAAAVEIVKIHCRQQHDGGD